MSEDKQQLLKDFTDECNTRLTQVVTEHLKRCKEAGIADIDYSCMLGANLIGAAARFIAHSTHMPPEKAGEAFAHFVTAVRRDPTEGGIMPNHPAAKKNENGNGGDNRTFYPAPEVGQA